MGSLVHLFAEIFVITVGILRLFLVKGEAAGNVSLLFLVPLGQLVRVLRLNRLLVDQVLPAVGEEFLIARDGEDLELCWIPLLSIYLLQHVLTRLEIVVVLSSARFANEDSMLQFEVSRLVSEAVDAIGVKSVLGHSLLQVRL